MNFTQVRRRAVEGNVANSRTSSGGCTVLCIERIDAGKQRAIAGLCGACAQWKETLMQTRLEIKNDITEEKANS